MTLLTHIPDHERLEWKLALLRHRPADRPGRHMATFVLGAMHQGALNGDLTMPEHWEQAVLTWRSRGFTPHTYRVLHQAVADLARLGYQVPVPPPGEPARAGERRNETTAPGERRNQTARAGGARPQDPATSGDLTPARRVPQRYRSWGGRPGPSPYALDPEQWAGAGDWVGSAIREVVLDLLQARAVSAHQD